MLFRYLHVRTLTLRQHECSRRRNHNARRLGTWPSSVTLRGTRGAFDACALRKNAFAAANSSVGAKEEVDGLALLVDRSIEIVPLGADRVIRLVDPPRGADGSRE